MRYRLIIFAVFSMLLFSSVHAQEMPVATENSPPNLSSIIPNITMVAESTMLVDLSGYFHDPEGDVITYDAIRPRGGVSIIRFDAAGDDSYDLHFTNRQGLEYVVPFVDNSRDEITVFKYGDDDDDLLFKEGILNDSSLGIEYIADTATLADGEVISISHNWTMQDSVAGSPIADKNGNLWPIDEDDYFVLTPAGGEGFEEGNQSSNTHVLSYETIHPTLQQIVFNDEGIGVITINYTNFASIPGVIGKGIIELDGYTYAVYVSNGSAGYGSASVGRYPLIIDLNADGKVNGREVRIVNKGGGIIDLGTQSFRFTPQAGFHRAATFIRDEIRFGKSATNLSTLSGNAGDHSFLANLSTQASQFHLNGIYNTGLAESLYINISAPTNGRADLVVPSPQNLTSNGMPAGIPVNDSNLVVKMLPMSGEELLQGFTPYGIYLEQTNDSYPGDADDLTIEYPLAISPRIPSCGACPQSSWTSLPQHYDGAIVSVNNTTNILNITSIRNFTGIFSIILAASDGNTSTLSNKIIVNVTNMNDSPTFRIQGTGENVTWGGNLANGTTLIDGNSSYTGENMSGIHIISFANGSSSLVNMTFNFSTDIFNFSKVSIFANASGVVVDLGGQLQSGHNKTIILSDQNFTSLCVKNAPVTSLSQISDSCFATGEINMSDCIGSNETIQRFGILCQDTGSHIIIQNLSYSAVRGVSTDTEQSAELPPTSGSIPSGSSGSSGGGGGGGSRNVYAPASTVIPVPVQAPSPASIVVSEPEATKEEPQKHQSTEQIVPDVVPEENEEISEADSGLIGAGSSFFSLQSKGGNRLVIIFISFFLIAALIIIFCRNTGKFSRK